MLIFFGVIAAVGAFIVWLAWVQTRAPSDSWPREMIANPIWGIGLLALGLFGFACAALF